MSSFQPTAAQRPAIYDRHRDILVSASAGSGKTAVLVNRVIQELIDNDQLYVDQLLLLTFTRAAAKNMRERIRKALEASQQPDFMKDEPAAKRNHAIKRLKPQINRLAMTDISTIDGFCQRLIKRYYYVIGLDPQYRMSNDVEQQLLKDQVYNQLENQGMGGQLTTVTKEQFVQLAANFADPTSNVGEGLQEVVEALYEKSDAQANPDQWLDQLDRDYDFPTDQDVTASHYYRDTLQPLFTETLQQAIDDMTRAVKIATDLGFEDQAGQMSQEQAQLQTIQQQLKTANWDKLQVLVKADIFKRLPSVSRNADADDKERYKDAQALRKEAKDVANQLAKDYFQLDNRQMIKLSQDAGQLVKQLIQVVKEFRRQYQQAKQNRQVLDYSDLEHYAYQILTNTSVTGQAVLHDLQQHYHEILVDEYQDTNQLQDAIVNRLHDQSVNNLFLVGDVKQSIYGFRQADPTLFQHKQDRFDQAADEQAETVNLAENFRSLKNVIDFTNLIFTQVMSKQLGDVDYDQAAKLRYAAKWYDQKKDSKGKAPAATEVLIYDANADSQTDDGKVLPTTHEDDKQSGEIRMAALRIRQLLDDENEQVYDEEHNEMRRIRPGDIAILERQRGINNQLLQEFSQLNIPVTVHDVKNYFQATEVRIMLSVLRLIDNPYQDIPLVAVLRSPIVAVSDPELALIRLADRDHTYYDAIQKFLKQHPTSKQVNSYGVNRERLVDKLSKFMDQLAKWQRFAARRPLVDLIWQIYETTGYMDYVTAMPNGEQRRANLHALYERAKVYEDSGLKGLYQFIHFIERMQKQNQDLGVAPMETDDNTVNVLTIHESKGLQFPIVFLVDSNRSFNTRDVSTMARFVINPHQAGQNNQDHPSLGIQYIGPAPAADDENSDSDSSPLLLKYILPQYKSAMNLQKQAGLAEEMRLLYVALTRAKQRLIITGSVNESQGKRGLHQLWQKWLQIGQGSQTKLPVEQLLNNKSFLQWIGSALIRTGKIDPATMGEEGEKIDSLKGLPNADFKLQVYDADKLSQMIDQLNQQPTAKGDLLQGPSLSIDEQEKIAKVIKMQYPHMTAEKTTAFQTVSAIRGLFNNQDPDDARMGRLTFDQQQVRSEGQYRVDDDFARPQFMASNEEKPPASVVGTATHLVFQKLDLHRGRVTLADINELIDSLTKKKLIPSAAVANAIDRAGIAAFYQTKLGQALLSHPGQVHREQPFSMLMDGQRLFKGLEKEKDDGHILIHGIIDGFLIEDDGISLFDYKTDWLTRNDYYRRQELINRYQGQVNLYATALSSWMDKAIKHRYLYFVKTHELYEITGENQQ